MQNQILKFTPLLGAGSGTARISKNSVSIETEGINGALKAWLVGGSEAVKIGNLVDGRLNKEIDTTDHRQILITQSGRHVFILNYKNDNSAPAENVPPSDGFDWQKVLSRKFVTKNHSVKYILSHTPVYDSFLRHGFYWLGKKGNIYSIAIPCVEGEKDPLSFLKLSGNIKKGFSYVFIDEENEKIYTEAT